MTEDETREPHAGYEELADLHSDLLPPEQAARLRAHVAGCTQCVVRAEAVTGTVADLGRLPAAPLPADVRSRIDQALAQAPTGATVVPLDAPRSRRWARWSGRPTLAGTAAGLVLLAAVGGIWVGHSRHRAGATAGGSTATTNSQSRPLVEAGPANYTRTASGRTYTPQSLAVAAPSLAAGAAGTDRTAPTGTARVPGSGVPSSLRHLYDSPQALLACAAAVTDTPGAVPLAVDFARWTNGDYHRAPSVIFVFRISQTLGSVTVTGPTCSNTDQIRYFGTVPLS